MVTRADSKGWRRGAPADSIEIERKPTRHPRSRPPRRWSPPGPTHGRGSSWARNSPGPSRPNPEVLIIPPEADSPVAGLRDPRACPEPEVPEGGPCAMHGRPRTSLVPAGRTPTGTPQVSRHTRSSVPQDQRGAITCDRWASGHPSPPGRGNPPGWVRFSPASWWAVLAVPKCAIGGE